MKKTILLLSVLCLIQSSYAQEGMRIGLKGGYNSTWLFNQNVSDVGPSLDYASTFGGNFGAQFIYMFAETYGMSIDVISAKQNQKYTGKNSVGNLEFKYDVEDNLSYLDIPILFRVSSEKGPYFEIGPQASLLMSAKETFTADGTGIGNYTDKDVKDDFNGFGLAGVFGFGVDIHLSEKLNLTTGLRFGYMFSDATTEYTEKEITDLSNANNLSANAGFNHFTTKDNKPVFDYQKSSRVYGGLNIGLQYIIK